MRAPGHGHTRRASLGPAGDRRDDRAGQRSTSRANARRANLAGPVRSCVSCRGAEAKDRLIRVVADPAGRVRIDDLRREPGRGAYVHPTRDCIGALQRKREILGRALRRNVILGPGLLESLERRLAAVPDAEPRQVHPAARSERGRDEAPAAQPAEGENGRSPRTEKGEEES